MLCTVVGETRNRFSGPVFQQIKSVPMVAMPVGPKVVFSGIKKKMSGHIHIKYDIN